MSTVIKIILMIAVIFPINNLYAQKSQRKFVTINNTEIAYKVFNFENRKEGDPIVVFESGLGSGGVILNQYFLSYRKT